MAEPSNRWRWAQLRDALGALAADAEEQLDRLDTMHPDELALDFDDARQLILGEDAVGGVLSPAEAGRSGQPVALAIASRSSRTSWMSITKLAVEDRIVVGTRRSAQRTRVVKKGDGVPTRRCACCQGPQTQRLPSVT